VSAATLSLFASPVASFGHLVFALAARRAGGATPRAFARLAFVLAAWSAALFASDLPSSFVGAEVPWIIALAVVPAGLELAARVHGAAPRLARAARFAWLAAALAAIPLAIREGQFIPFAAALLFPALVAMLWALRVAFARRRQRARGILVAGAAVIAASAIDAAALFFPQVEWKLPRLASLASLALVAQLGSSVARHRLFELKPVLGRAATLAVLALLAALACVEVQERTARESPLASRIVAWCVVLGFALAEQPLLRALRSPAARAAAKRRRALVDRLATIHHALAGVTALDELLPALARHLTASPVVRAVEFARRARASEAHPSAVVVLPLRSLDRREGWLRIAFGDPALPRHRTVRRALRVLADRVAAYASALRLRDEQQRAQRLAQLGAVAAEVAHEVKNPLGAILGALDLVDGASPDDARHWWNIVRDEARRLDRVVTDALTLGREIQPRLVAAAPARVVADVCVLAAAKATAARVVLAQRVAADAPAVRCDPDLVLQALLNVVLNGVAVQPEGGRVEVAFEAADGSVRFHVRDDGPGIPDELRMRVFEPFFTTRATGSGLGLAVAQKVAAAHEGRLFLAAPDAGFRGAHFVLELPRRGRDGGAGHGA
jgi:signal transduction histidine kinase